MTIQLNLLVIELIQVVKLKTTLVNLIKMGNRLSY